MDTEPRWYLLSASSSKSNSIHPPHVPWHDSSSALDRLISRLPGETQSSASFARFDLLCRPASGVSGRRMFVITVRQDGVGIQDLPLSDAAHRGRMESTGNA